MQELTHSQKIKKIYRENNKEKVCSMQKQWRNTHPQRVWASSVKGHHKSNGYIVDITLDELENMANMTTNCPICGVNLNYSTRNGNTIERLSSPSLDRINNELHLNKDNVWIICTECNITKGRKLFKHFVEYCKMVGEKFG
jgi:hypothetical protein